MTILKRFGRSSRALFLSAAMAPVMVACVVPSATSPSSSAPAERLRSAISDTHQKLDFYNSLNPDCTSPGIPVVTVTKQAAHGQLSFDLSSDYPNFARDNQRYECNKKSVPGVTLYYQSAAGYSGDDAGVVHIIFPGGTFSDVSYRIDVKARQ